MSKEAVEIITRTQGLHPDDAIKQFTTEPVDELASTYILNDLKTSMQTALNYDLTRILELDQRYRYANAGDISVCIRGRPNHGKTAPKGSKVLMGSGSWKNVEDVVVGDFVVSPQFDGTTQLARVVETHSRWEEEIYDFYRLRTGEKLFSCAGNHDVPIRYLFVPKENGKKIFSRAEYRIKIEEAAKVFKRMTERKRIYLLRGFKCKYAQPDVIINPYLFGLWLGDGYAEKSRCDITDGDPEVVAFLRNQPGLLGFASKAKSPKCYCFRFKTDSELAKALLVFGLNGKRSGDKFIPDCVKCSTPEYRAQVLAGLIDTDGYVDSAGNMKLMLKSERLIRDFADVVFSLGGDASITSRKKKCYNNGKVGTYYEVAFRLPEALPLKTTDKIRRQTIGLERRREGLGTCTFSIKRGTPNMVYGFEIDSPSHFFVTDNWIITHNSNILLSYGLLWSRITGVAYRMSNIVWTLPEFNLLLKQLKFRQRKTKDGRLESYLEDFVLEPGASVSLDEAGDVALMGRLSMSVALSTADLEARCRAKQWGRFFSGVRELNHQSYYSLYAIQRNPIRRECIALVYVPGNNSGNTANNVVWLGFVRVPYVPQEVFAAYNKPKMESIDKYGRSGGQARISQLIELFSNELRENREFQKLPLKPNDRRILWLENSDRYAVFPTEKYISQLEKLSRNKEMHDELTARDSYKVLTRDEYHPVEGGVSQEGGQKALLNPRFVDEVEEEGKGEEEGDSDGVGA